MRTPLSETNVDSDADRLFKALADSGRRRLLDRLRVRGEQTLQDLCEGMAMSRQAVTKHLLQLEEANLVVVRWKGREKFHYLNPVPIHSIAKRWIKPFESPRLDALRNLKIQLDMRPMSSWPQVPSKRNNERED